MSANIRLDIDRFRTSDRPQSAPPPLSRTGGGAGRGRSEDTELKPTVFALDRPRHRPDSIARIPQLDDRAHAHQGVGGEDLIPAVQRILSEGPLLGLVSFAQPRPHGAG